MAGTLQAKWRAGLAEHDLTPKRALITGAGKRIGRALAEALGADGWSVAVHYRSSADGAQETADAIGKAGGMGVIVQGERRLIGREGVGFQPVFAHDNGVDRHRPHLFDKFRELVSDLSVSRLIIGDRRLHGADAAVCFEFDDIGRDRPLCGLPDQSSAKPA